MIRNSVIFKLKPQISAAEKTFFFEAVNQLAKIEGVEQFEVLEQISKKNNFEYGISMEFANAELFENYSNHPANLHFIKNFWLKNVEDFLEIDYKKIN